MGPVERTPLILADGRHAYVEPMDLVRVGEGFVVTGTPTYVWEMGLARAAVASERRHIAAYLDEEPPRLVEKPLDVDVGAVRSVALGPRSWGMLFSELSREEPSRFREASGLWYAEYDGEGWSDPESVPMPPQGQTPELHTSSPLVLHEGVLRWAVVTRRPGAALLYERRNGAWSVQRIEDAGLEATALAGGPSGLWLALSGVDPGITGPRKSVRLLHWDEDWRLVSRNQTTESYTEIRSPSVMVLRDGVTLTWVEQRGPGVVMARVGIGVDDPGRLVLVDAAAPVVWPVLTEAQEPAWVVQHVNEISRADELRLLRLDGRSTTLVHAIPYPYTGFYAAAAAGPDEVVVTGSEFSPDPARPTVRSLTLRLNPSCQ